MSVVKAAVISEVSASARNADVVLALEKAGATVLNVGMTSPEDKVELTYIHTGFMAGLLINAEVCDMVIGGCGTGQGFLNSVVQYPSVICGLILEPVDAWLFSQINSGNCVSLALNKGYGWAAELNLQNIFEKLFKDPMGGGFPVNRSASQAESRSLLKQISGCSHRGMEEIIPQMPKDVLKRVAACAPFIEVLGSSPKGAAYVDALRA